MRLFVAIQFSEEIKQSLKKFQAKLKQNGVTGRFVPVENLHLTLAFIGDYPDPEQVLEAMEQVPFSSFDIELKGTGSFNDLFWVGIKENAELKAYVKRLRRALAEQGIPFDRKKFSPHITLIRRGAEKEAFAMTPPPQGRMKAERISLMRSDRGKAGMIYTEVGAII